MRTRSMEQIWGAGQAGEVLIKCYKAGGFVIPGMISHGLSTSTSAHRRHRTSLGSVDYFMEQCATF